MKVDRKYSITSSRLELQQGRVAASSTRLSLPDFMTVLDRNGVEQVIMMSPHPDDVAFSFGATATYIAARYSTTIITVFGNSVWCPNLDPILPSSKRVSSLRAEEDLAFADAIGAKIVRLDHDDASLRGYDDQSETGAVCQDDPAPALVERALLSLLQVDPRTAIFAPQGIGTHVDHCIARDAVLALCRNNLVLLYEDLPYAAMREDYPEELRILGETVPIRCALNVEFPKEMLDSKLTLAGLYRSQFREEDRLAIRQRALRWGSPESCREAFVVIGDSAFCRELHKSAV